MAPLKAGSIFQGRLASTIPDHSLRCPSSPGATKRTSTSMALISSSGVSTLRNDPTDPGAFEPSRVAPRAGSERPATPRLALTSAATRVPLLYTGRSVRQRARSQPSLSILSRQASSISGAFRLVPVRGSTTTGTSQETPPSTCLARRSGSSEASSLAIFCGMSGAAIRPSVTVPACSAWVEGETPMRLGLSSLATATSFASSPRGPFGSGLQQDLHRTVLLLLEDLVSARVLLQRQPSSRLLEWPLFVLIMPKHCTNSYATTRRGRCGASNPPCSAAYLRGIRSRSPRPSARDAKR